MLNAGIITRNGSEPLTTPNCTLLGALIAALAIDPMLPLPSVSAASTLTSGDVRSDVGFVNVNVIAQSVFAATVVPTVSTSVPVSFFQLPVVPSELLAHVVTARLADVAVSDPASPVIVTVASDVPPVVRS